MDNRSQHNQRIELRTLRTENVIHEIGYFDCEQCYINLLGKDVFACLREHKLATTTRDRRYLTSGHEEQNTFGLDKVNVTSHKTCKGNCAILSFFK